MTVTDQLESLLQTLETLGVAGQWHQLKIVAQSGVGHIKAPDPSNSWDAQRFEIKLFEVYAEGDSQHEALRAWTKAAHAMLTKLRSRQHDIDAAITLIDSPKPLPSDMMRELCLTLTSHPHLVPVKYQRLAEVILQRLPVSAAA